MSNFIKKFVNWEPSWELRSSDLLHSK